MNVLSKQLKPFIEVLEIYGKTDELVTQGFYQGLCIKAKKYLADQQAEIERLNRCWDNLQNDTLEFRQLACNAEKQSADLQARIKQLEEALNKVSVMLETCFPGSAIGYEIKTALAATKKMQ